MRTIIIGDVHGCLAELNELLALLELTFDDHLIFVGDLIDKGPNSVGVVRRVRNIRNAGYNVYLVEGNHEENFRRWLKRHQRGEDTSSSKRDADFKAYLAAMDKGDLALLRSAVRYIKLIKLFGYALITHAGVPSELDHLPDDPSEVAALSNSKRKHYDRMCRMRYIDTEGKYVHLDDVKKGMGFWADAYDGRLGFTIFGHEPFIGDVEPRRFPHALGIDLGCVFGGRLCALIIESGMHRHVTVKARQKYDDPLTWEDS